MPVLSNDDRDACADEYMHTQKARTGQNAGNTTKHDDRALIDALDDWLDANAAAANQAIPAAIRSEYTPQQKALGLMVVITRRYLRA